MAQRIVQQLSSVTATSPVSQIRLDCHWWQPEGKLACLRCPQVMTENYSKLPMHLNCVFTLEEIDSLFEPANRDRLAELVSNHVVAGEYFYSELTNGLSLETVRRDELTFTRKSGTVSIDNLAYIIEADIQSSNGIIQVIDSVLSY